MDDVDEGVDSCADDDDVGGRGRAWVFILGVEKSGVGVRLVLGLLHGRRATVLKDAVEVCEAADDDEGAQWPDEVLEVCVEFLEEFFGPHDYFRNEGWLWVEALEVPLQSLLRREESGVVMRVYITTHEGLPSLALADKASRRPFMGFCRRLYKRILPCHCALRTVIGGDSTVLGAHVRTWTYSRATYASLPLGCDSNTPHSKPTRKHNPLCRPKPSPTIKAPPLSPTI